MSFTVILENYKTDGFAFSFTVNDQLHKATLNDLVPVINYHILKHASLRY